jgi:hypothetical protein
LHRWMGIERGRDLPPAAYLPKVTTPLLRESTSPRVLGWVAGAGTGVAHVLAIARCFVGWVRNFASCSILIALCATSRADKRRGEPDPLAGVDGAATAGLGQDMLKGRLSRLHLAVRACQYAPALVRCNCRCDCCSGQRPNPQWQRAASYVAADARLHALAGCNAQLRFVQAVLAREYGGNPRRINLTDVGEGLGMSLGACTGRCKRVINWLLLDMRGLKC